MTLERPISELLRRAGVLVYTAPETSVQSAVETMAQHNIGSILVMEDGEDLVGIFSERDLLTRVIAEGLDPASTPVRDVMTKDVIVVSGETSRREALHIMQEQHIRHLPIADDKKLYGIVSLRDLLAFEQEMQAQEIEQLRRFVYDKPYPSYPG
jgi:CBS domain-containing protein